jgi:zinc and cadmium transporter
VAFFVLEQFLHRHYCPQAVSRDRLVGHLILPADGLHNLIRGLAVGSAFVTDLRHGVVTWLVAAAHGVPQELGGFGILVASGWSKRSSLGFNVASGLTFLVGGLIAFAGETIADTSLLLPFAAGNIICIASSDLIPSSRRRRRGTSSHASPPS